MTSTSPRSKWTRVIVGLLSCRTVHHDIRDGDMKHVSVAGTQDSYVLNHQPWFMNFTNVQQKFDPRNCDEQSDYLLDREATAP